MDKKFYIIGENCHCSRLVLLTGKSVLKSTSLNGTHELKYRYIDSSHNEKFLTIPEDFLATNAAARDGKLKFVALGIYTLLHEKSTDNKLAGKIFLAEVLKRQLIAGADFLDLNVDEFSHRMEDKLEALKVLLDIAESEVAEASLCIDSSSFELLELGISRLIKSGKSFMINSVNLKNCNAVLELLSEFDLNAKSLIHFIASAVGEDGEISNFSISERIDNLEKLHQILVANGIKDGQIHFDPLVFPLAVDQDSAKNFLECAKILKGRYPNCHVSGGLSNVSFGLPERNWVNNYFLKLAVEAGADSGILDPLNVSMAKCEEISLEAKERLNELFSGEDFYGMEYLSYCKSCKN